MILNEIVWARKEKKILKCLICRKNKVFQLWLGALYTTALNIPIIYMPSVRSSYFMYIWVSYVIDTILIICRWIKVSIECLMV